MFIHSLLFAIRSFSRNKTLSFTRIVGLVIGICACLIVFLIANFELSFDRFQPDRHRIYRVYTEVTGISSKLYSGAPTGWYLPIKNEFSGVESACNFHTLSAGVKVPEPAGVSNFGMYHKIMITPPDYFDVFNFYEWVIGSPTSALEAPSRVVLTESRARQYFGSLSLADVIGREIRYNDSLIVTVSGIVRDVPERTDFDFTDFLSFSTIESTWLRAQIPLDSWHSVNTNSQLFIKLEDNASFSQIEQQIPRLAEVFNRRYKNSWTFLPRFQPLSELHFNPTIGIFDHSRSVPDKSVLYTLIIVALFLLGISVVNYINLETAQATDRQREVGIRKTLGSTRAALIFKFLIQSSMYAGCAVVISPVLAWIALQHFGNLVPPGVALDFTDPWLLAFLICCFVGVTLMAGLYPAFVLSSFQPAHAIRNLANYNGGARAGFVRKVLTIFQFAFSQVLIILTIVVGAQLDYILNKDLGFSHDDVIYFLTPFGESREKTTLLRNELMKLPGVEAITLGAPPTSLGLSATIVFEDAGEMKIHDVLHVSADTSFLSVFEIELLAGANFSSDDRGREYVINETYLHTLGFDEPAAILGKVLDRQYPIVGVVKDFHTQSLHSAVKPLVMYNAGSYCISIKPASARSVTDLRTLLERIEASWAAVFPDKKIEVKFVDDTIRRFYEVELRASTLMKLGAVTAIFISCLGLFSLASLTVVRRKKEISIRKVSGASVKSIVVLLSTGLLKHVIIAFVIAVPVAYYFSHDWLLTFAYRRELTAWIFIVAGILTILIAILTVSLQTVGAARTNPAKYLRHE